MKTISKELLNQLQEASADYITFGEAKAIFKATEGCEVLEIIAAAFAYGFDKGRRQPAEVVAKVDISGLASLPDKEPNPGEVEGYKRGTNKAIRCIETDSIYESLKAAAEATGFNMSMLSNACRGYRELVGGYHWEYVGSIREING